MISLQVGSKMKGLLISFIAIFLLISLEMIGGAEGKPQPGPQPAPAVPAPQPGPAPILYPPIHHPRWGGRRNCPRGKIWWRGRCFCFYGLWVRNWKC